MILGFAEEDKQRPAYADDETPALVKHLSAPYGRIKVPCVGAYDLSIHASLCLVQLVRTITLGETNELVKLVRRLLLCARLHVHHTGVHSVACIEQISRS